ncbi:MAG TPA: HDOD domain-containing protein [Leptolinea sp.]
MDYVQQGRYILDVKKIVQSVDQLYPMPTNVTRVIKALEDANIGAFTISELIGLDQALASNTLKMANSVTFGYASECSNLHDAVVRLGFKKIKSIMLGAASFSNLNKPLNGYNLKIGELWNHSVATGMAAQWLARKFGKSDPEEAYVAGLLHDIGKVLLNQYLELDQSIILITMQTLKIGLWEAEARVFGVDHAGLGALIAKKWNFPPKLIDAIRYHHAPALSDDYIELASIINIANSFVTKEKIGIIDIYGSMIHPEALRVLKLTENDTQVLRKKMFDAFGVNSDLRQ